MATRILRHAECCMAPPFAAAGAAHPSSFAGRTRRNDLVRTHVFAFRREDRP